MSSYLYAPIGYIYSVCDWSSNWFSDWLAIYVYNSKRQPPKITYIRCFNCHNENVMNKGGHPDDIKSKYCVKCYNELLQEAMHNLISGMH